MTQEIEIEFKNIVTKDHFNDLLTAFSVTERNFKKQVNHYFDTKDFQIKAHGSALRIREKDQEYTLTLKQPNEIGLLETHQSISSREANIVFQGGRLPKGRVSAQLYTSFKIDLSHCYYLGSLTTNRAELNYAGGTLVFDHSFYLGVEDFEIEYEVQDEKKGKEIFDKLFFDHQIPLNHTDNKIKRFFNKKREQIKFN